MRSITEIEVKESTDKEGRVLVVESHDSNKHQVFLAISGIRIAVLASELEAAIKNATNK